MPIRIDITSNNDVVTIAYLCEGSWTITPLLYALDTWLKEHEASLDVSQYIIDIGISHITSTASGGGGVLSSETIQIMAKYGMELWISEYGDE